MKASIFCPHCHRHTALSVAPVWQTENYGDSHSLAVAIWRDTINGFWWIGLCNFCSKPSLVLNDGKIVYPNPIPKPTDERVPEKIRKDLDEAKACFSIGAFRAAAIMARRTIESTTIDKGHAFGNLMKNIDSMASTGQITAEVKEWAHVVRWVGNDAAHPNGNEVNREDAEDIIELAEQLLQIVYVTPAIAQNRRSERGR